MTRKILYLSGTRADFGLMRRCLHRISQTAGLDLSLCVTGMHLSPRHGGTIAEIEESGLPVAARIPTRHEAGDGAEMARAIAGALEGSVAALERIRPDILLLLGDRGEMLAGALAAAHLNIHTAHIHGGETSGTVDEMLRHCITKLAHYHFAATERSREVLRRLGENEAAIFVTGAPGLDGLADSALRSRRAVTEDFGFDPARPLALALFHPVVQSAEEAGAQMRDLMTATLDQGLQIVALQPNADAGNLSIRAELEKRAGHGAIRLITHLPRGAFVDLMARADVMIGNSSSGVIEAATFGTPVVNVGDRQRGRERNRNIRDCEATYDGISAALRAALSGGRYPAENIYGDGRAGARIAALLRDLPLEPALLNKALNYDL